MSKDYTKREWRTHLSKDTRILIVEDDEVTVFLHEKLLQGHCLVKSVRSGYEALNLLQKEAFDLILMDINLGDIHMDGIKTMRIIRKEPSQWHIKIVAVTAYANNRKWYMEQGFDELVLKPLTAASLLTVLLNVLHKNKSPLETGFSLN